jgi:cytochrome c oxidase subunit 1
MFIAVPTGVKILNWLATMWGGKLKFDTPMLFAVGLIAMFTIGGLSGVSHSVAPSDTQQTDTYYIVAHLHYVLFGGALMGFFGGMYFWWPKVFGYRLSEKWGKIHFWSVLVGFNLTFAPMHILGLEGMPRRIYSYRNGYGFNFWNAVCTFGAFVIFASMLTMVYNILKSMKEHRLHPVKISGDPWDARSLEWMLQCPTPAHNFDEVPTVTQLDEFWTRKYGEDDDGRLVRIAASEDVIQKGDPTGVHLPSPSYFPIVLASGLPLIGWGLIYNMWLCVVGGALVIFGLYGWVMEPSTDPAAPHADDEGGHPDDHGSDGAVTSTEAASAEGGDESGPDDGEAVSDQEASLVD